MFFCLSATSDNFCFLNHCLPFLLQKTSEVMNAEIFSALTRNVGKLREMKKAHEEMSAELAQLKLEKEQASSKWLQIHFFEILLFRVFCLLLFSPDQQMLLLR